MSPTRKSPTPESSGRKSQDQIPGAPASQPPSLAEPTEPREPLPTRPDQRPPAAVSATGSSTGAPGTARAQSGAYLTTAQGVRLPDTDHSLKAGARGPTLLQDHHLREKITHFDHERIPERVVHARGAAAHGISVPTARRRRSPWPASWPRMWRRRCS